MRERRDPASAVVSLINPASNILRSCGYRTEKDSALKGPKIALIRLRSS
jgi:hypothetical protein